MKRFPHKIEFRLTPDQYKRYVALIGKVYGVHSWTDLCRAGLLAIYDIHVGTTFPLGSVPVPQDLSPSASFGQNLKKKPPTISQDASKVDETECGTPYSEKKLAPAADAAPNRRLKKYAKKLLENRKKRGKR